LGATARLVQLAWRSLTARLTRTLLTMSGVMLGVGVILAVSITNLSTMDSIRLVFTDASGRAHLVVTDAGADDEGFREAIRADVAALPGVHAAVPTVQGQALLADEATPEEMGVSFFGAVGGGITLYGIDPALDTEARQYRVVAGRFLDASVLNARDIVMVEAFAEEKSLALGQDIQVLTPYGVTDLHIVGLIAKEGPGQVNNGAFGVIPLDTAQALFGRAGRINQIDVVVTPEAATVAQIDALKNALQARLGDAYSVIYPAAQGKRVTQMLDTYQMGLDFMSVVALFVGTFLIYNAFSMTVVERTREIGMLRTVGMTRRQVTRQILTEAAVLGLLGSLLGLGLGITLSRGLIRIMEIVMAQEVREVRIPLDGLVTSMAIGLGATLIAALIPSWQAGRISPLEALRIRGNRREGWLMRHGWLPGVGLLATASVILYRVTLAPSLQTHLSSLAILLLFLGGTFLIPATVTVWERIARPWVLSLYGSEGHLGSRNIERSRLRTTLTVAALMIGVAMILTMRGMTSAYERDIRAWVNAYIGGDLYVYSNLPMRTDLGRRLESIEGVRAVTPIRYLSVNRLKPDGTKERLTLTVVDPATYRHVTSFVFADDQGNADRLLDELEQGGTVYVSSVLSEMYGLQRGDTIRLETRRGQHDFRVAAVVVDFYDQGMVLEGSWRDMRRYFGVNHASAFLLKLEPRASVEEVQERIQTVYGQRRHLTVQSNKSLKERAFTLMAQAFSLFDVLALIAMIVASLGVVNTLTMNVMERTQEIGMLRGVGMTRRQVAKMILAEAGVMGLIGGAFGIAFGLFLLRLTLVGIAEVQGYELGFVLPTQGILVSLLIALVVSQLAALWPARRAARINVIEAIHTE
jgi:putative ABC transport system permease protein